MKERVTAERLRQLLDCDPVAGVLIWKVARGSRAKVGSIAGSIDSHGHRQICVDGKYYMAHWLVWFFVTGKWPEKEIDHRNNIRDDNRFENLRPSSDQQQCFNSKIRKDNRSGCKGVRHRGYRSWQARIRVSRKLIVLGTFPTREEAHQAYCKAAEKHAKEFARTG